MVLSRLLNKKNNVSEKEFNKFIAFFSYFLTLIIIVLVDIFILKIPDKLNVDFIQNIYFADISDFVAEKSELLAYIFSMFFFPIVYYLSFLILKKNKERFIKYDLHRINKIFEIMSVVFLFLLFILIMWKAFETYIPIIHHLLLCSLLIFFLIYMVFRKKKTKISDIVFGVLVFFIICFISYLHINYNYAQNGYMMHHFDAYYYPILKIQSGLTPLVDFKSLYGNYSYFFALILSCFDTNKIFIFSIICSILVFISFALMSVFSYKTIKNKAIWFLTMCVVLFTAFFGNFYDYSSVYLQTIPHRIIFPSIILVYILFYMKRNGNKLLMLCGYLICSLALFWNIETGIVVSGTWVLFLLYELFYFNDFNKETLFKCLGIIAWLFVSVILYLVLILAIVYVRTGRLFSLSFLLSGILVFSGDGCMMLRMPFLHPWILLVIVYSIGLALSIKNFKTGCFHTNAIYFILSIFGIGFFAYYQGRSDDGVFYGVLYPGIILFGLFLDKLFEKKKLKGVVCFCCLFLAFYTVAMFSYMFDYRTRFFLKKRDLRYNYFEKRLQAYSSLVSENPNIDFITNYEVMYYDYFDLDDKKPFPGHVDLFKYEDIEKIISYLKVCRNNVVIKNDVYVVIKNKYYDDYKLLKEKYSISKFDAENYIFMLKGD